MKYESAWVKQRTDRTGKPWYGYLKYRDVNGKWKQTCKVLKTFADAKGNEKPVRGIRQAEKALAAWRQEMEATSVQAPSADTYVPVYVNSHLDARALKDDKRTIAQYRSYVKNHFGEFEHVPLGKLTHGQIQAWVISLNEDGCQPGTIHRIFGVLRMTCIHAVKVGDLTRNPCSAIELPPLPEATPNAMEPQDIAALLDDLDGMGPTRLATAATIALLAGLRIGEVCALTWADWNEDDGILSVTKSIAYDANEGIRVKSPKTRAGVRDIPIPPRLSLALSRRKALMLEQLEEVGGGDIDALRIIGEVDGSTVSPHSISLQWSQYAKKHDLTGGAGKKLTFHSLRDCYGTSLLGAGVDVRTAADMMGHGDGGAVLLKYYATALDSAKRNAALRLNAALETNQG